MTIFSSVFTTDDRNAPISEWARTAILAHTMEDGIAGKGTWGKVLGE